MKPCLIESYEENGSKINIYSFKGSRIEVLADDPDKERESLNRTTNRILERERLDNDTVVIDNPEKYGFALGVSDEDVKRAWEEEKNKKEFFSQKSKEV